MLVLTSVLLFFGCILIVAARWYSAMTDREDLKRLGPDATFREKLSMALHKVLNMIGKNKKTHLVTV